jgi:hypothetical protein
MTRSVLLIPATSAPISACPPKRCQSDEVGQAVGFSNVAMAWSEPYFVTVIETEHGWIMDGVPAPTEAAARAEAIDILAGMDGGSSPIGRAPGQFTDRARPLQKHRQTVWTPSRV